MANAGPLPPNLPIAQLESLKFKANQMIESIQLLQRTIEFGGQNVMPPWPDILSKYNILLSQSHNLTASLVGQLQTHGPHASHENPYEKLALHPLHSTSEAQMDNEVIPLLRTQQTTDVLKLEGEVVRHLAEHMATKGSVGVLNQAGRKDSQGKRVEYEDVLRECEQIRTEHDSRVERAVRAVAMLREKYDWKARVAVDQEEPEELEWDTHLQAPGASQAETEGAAEELSEDGGSHDSEEEEELEEVLGNVADQTPEGTPRPPDHPLPSVSTEG
ncbi:hypothetical protein CERSUDRAFT_143840 [Gelatoporia subvermispora B]|uniref:Mediator of RNA polymerase II transcription subunit 8 n=1 Tax=Ceriporiopsis subvermispora (strain B) TaxID=914234 RepID=M2R2B4_CERS8|nr:hypothetical protein CERSUDRAFT_143840 [Gelatoporia subvermispora B]